MQYDSGTIRYLAMTNVSSVEEGSHVAASIVRVTHPGGESLYRTHCSQRQLLATYARCAWPHHLFVTNLLQDQPVLVYSDGRQVRDWLTLENHYAGIHHALMHRQPAEVHNIGGGNEHANMEMLRLLLPLLGKPANLICYFAQRLGHDLRYALDCSKLHALGWQPYQRVEWCRQNQDWLQSIRNGGFTDYYSALMRSVRGSRQRRLGRSNATGRRQDD